MGFLPYDTQGSLSAMARLGRRWGGVQGGLAVKCSALLAAYIEMNQSY